MCGVAGIFHLKGSVERADLRRMAEMLVHRGPDDRGIYLCPDGHVGLAHTRLSVIDLSEAARQPMGMADGSTWIVYNGEVYNYREIRRDLEAKGYRFFSSSDTEVVLKAYTEWGLHCLSRLNGMFAFGIWDGQRRRLVLVRDRAGVKPLYYYWDGRLLLFASELKGLMASPGFPRRINPSGVAEYFRWGFVPAPESVFENTYKLEPGHYVVIEEGGSLRKEPYWEAPGAEAAHQREVQRDQLLEELRQLVISAFQYRLVADVPVGVFLSGGVDSSLVAAVLRRELGVPVRTFTIGFREQKYDESIWAGKVARYLGTDHHQLICSAADMQRLVLELPEIYDEPFADSSAIPTCLLARFARDAVKVALSADGGDELFGGYRHHLRLLRVVALRRFPAWRLVLDRMSRGLIGPSRVTPAIRWLSSKAGVSAAEDRARRLGHVLGQDSVPGMHLAYLRYWQDEELREVFKDRAGLQSPVEQRFVDALECGDAVNAMLRLDFSLGMPDDMLTKVDRACMHVGLENREPMLDYRIVEWAFSLPGGEKIRNGVGKALLKSLLERYLPPRWVHRPKQGFIVPLDSWLEGHLRPVCQEWLSEESVKRSGLFEEKMVAKYVNGFLENRGISGRKIWALLMFQLWWQQWMTR